MLYMGLSATPAPEESQREGEGWRGCIRSEEEEYQGRQSPLRIFIFYIIRREQGNFKSVCGCDSNFIND